MTEITQEEMKLLEDAVASIIDGERESCPERDDTFWKQFAEIVLAEVIKRKAEILGTEKEAQ